MRLFTNQRGGSRLIEFGLILILFVAIQNAAEASESDTDLSTPQDCYYNYNHYSEGDRILTNEPCLNCTCHNKMLMCYLKVCPFTKPIGQDCTIEKREDQCCPIITCPEVPVELDSSVSSSSTALAGHQPFGCTIEDKFYPEGAQIPGNPKKPCELCYCIRNMTSCVMQECTLHVDGCRPIYNKGVCCPVRYDCAHEVDEGYLIEDSSTTTEAPSEGFMITTTAPSVQVNECIHNGITYRDGELVTTEPACEHCYCMRGDIVCAVQECGTPFEMHGKNCTAHLPKEGECCPQVYDCEGDERATEIAVESTTLKQRLGETATESDFAEVPTTPESIDESENEIHDEQHTAKPVVKLDAVELTTLAGEERVDTTIVPDTTERATEKEESTTAGGLLDNLYTTIKTIVDLTTTFGPSLSDETTQAPHEEHEDHSLLSNVIPGEGDCLESGVSYLNSSQVPNRSKCEVSCVCLNSIVHCEQKKCPPMPPNAENCRLVQDPSECCASYQCDSLETTTPFDQSRLETTTAGLTESATEIVTEAVTSRLAEAEQEVSTTAGLEATTVAELGADITTVAPSESEQTSDDGATEKDAEQVTMTAGQLVEEIRTAAAAEEKEATTPSSLDQRLDEEGIPERTATTEAPLAQTSAPEVEATTVAQLGEEKIATTSVPLAEAPEMVVTTEATQLTTEKSVAEQETERIRSDEIITTARAEVETTTLTIEKSTEKVTTELLSEGEVTTEGRVEESTTLEQRLGIEATTSGGSRQEEIGTTEQSKAAEATTTESYAEAQTTSHAEEISEETTPKLEELTTLGGQPIDEATTVGAAAEENATTQRAEQEVTEKQEEVTTVGAGRLEEVVATEKAAEVTEVVEGEQTTAKPILSEGTTAAPEEHTTLGGERLAETTMIEGKQEQLSEATTAQPQLEGQTEGEARLTTEAEVISTTIRGEIAHETTTLAQGEAVTELRAETERPESTEKVTAAEVETTEKPVVHLDVQQAVSMTTEKAVESGTSEQRKDTVTEGVTEETVEGATEAATKLVEGEASSTEGFTTEAHTPEAITMTRDESITVSYNQERVTEQESSATTTEAQSIADEQPQTTEHLEVTTGQLSQQETTSASTSEASIDLREEGKITETPTDRSVDEATTVQSLERETSTTEEAIVKVPLATEAAVEGLEKSTEATTEFAAEAATEGGAVGPTESATEKATEKAAEIATEGITEGATEKSTEKVTEAATEGVIDAATEGARLEETTTTETASEKQVEQVTELHAAEQTTLVAEEKPTGATEVQSVTETKLAEEQGTESAQTTTARSVEEQQTTIASSSAGQASPEGVPGRLGEEQTTEAKLEIETTTAQLEGEAPITTERQDEEVTKVATEKVTEHPVEQATEAATEAVTAAATEVSATESANQAATEQEQAISTEAAPELSATAKAEYPEVTETGLEEVTEAQPGQTTEGEVIASTTLTAEGTTVPSKSTEKLLEAEATTPSQEQSTLVSHAEGETARAELDVTTESIEVHDQISTTAQPSEAVDTTTARAGEQPIESEGGAKYVPEITTLAGEGGLGEQEIFSTTVQSETLPPLAETEAAVEQTEAPLKQQDEITEPAASATTEAAAVATTEETEAATTEAAIEGEVTTARAEATEQLATESAAQQTTTLGAVTEQEQQATTAAPSEELPKQEIEVEATTLREAVVTVTEATESDNCTGTAEGVQTTSTPIELATEGEAIQTTASSAFQEPESVTSRLAEGEQKPTEGPAEATTMQREAESTQVPLATEQTPAEGEKVPTTMPSILDTTTIRSLSDLITTIHSIAEQQTTLSPTESQTEEGEIATSPPLIRQPSQDEIPTTKVADELAVEATTTTSPLFSHTEEASSEGPTTASAVEEPLAQTEKVPSEEYHPEVVSTERVPELASSTTTSTQATATNLTDQWTTTTAVPIASTSLPPVITMDSGYENVPSEYPDEYEEESPVFGPGTCRYGGKLYVSAQQIPRDDPCDFCFCFRSDIICLQQSCPPPINNCHEEPIQGFCCPRYECPVSMALVMNATSTTTTTTLPPLMAHFARNNDKVMKRGCQVQGVTYQVGEHVKGASGPCIDCICGGDGQMKCEPKVCTPEPMLRQMIAVAASRR